LVANATGRIKARLIAAIGPVGEHFVAGWGECYTGIRNQPAAG
jgi:hypothetical protein